MADNLHRQSGKTRVAYVRKEHAKTVKSRLKALKFLDDRFRMLPAVSVPDTAIQSDNANTFIAIPVLEEFNEDTIRWVDGDGDETKPASSTPKIVEIGYQICPYSTKILGNGRTNHPNTSTHAGNGTAPVDRLSPIQSVILNISPTTACAKAGKSGASPALEERILDRVLKLDPLVCPASRRRQFLEIFGDDRTVVVPHGAFEGDEFLSILRDVRQLHQRKKDGENSKNASLDPADETTSLYNDFWRRLALLHGSPRVVRRGAIDPNSRIRESGHRILWPIPTTEGNADAAGPQSHSWIRVTEQGVKQSFDLTKVMFSRGNISEKIRFGKQLVREGDIILDMYAGIGYYTLPAVIHGKAAKVYACEWNEHAVSALRFNVKDNKIQEQVEIFVGDCRKSVEKHSIVNLVDRVSLGLLPSSEGGWRAAIRALKEPSGGWLHVHGNVPVTEMESWTLWLCHRLKGLARDEGKPNEWWVLCDHVERVKSFAPTVFHYVADVFVGIPSKASYIRGHTFLEGMLAPVSSDDSNEVKNSCRAWMRRRSDQTWVPALDDKIIPPSCALSPDGVLSQDWMR